MNAKSWFYAQPFNGPDRKVHLYGDTQWRAVCGAAGSNQRMSPKAAEITCADCLAKMGEKR